MHSESFLKIGKFGRSIFWAVTMTLSAYALFSIVSDLFTKEGRVFFSRVFSGPGDVLLFIFLYMSLLVYFGFAIYHVTHPYVSKEDAFDYDGRDHHWAFGICTIVIIITLHILFKYFFSINLLDALLSGNIEI